MSISLKYKSVCITGTLALMTREDAVGAIEAAGGYFDKSVSSSTSYLVIADKPGATKVNKAKTLGTKTLTERQFLNILKGEDKDKVEIPKKEETKTIPNLTPINLQSRDW